LFIDSASKSVVRLKAGENHKGWVLRAVERRQVEFAKGLDIAVLDIPSPDMKAGAVPGGPVLAGPPPVPVAMPVPPPQGAPTSPSYVHPGASKSLTINKNAQPANFKLPPGLVSPFATQGQR
jgi:general secretion pathway protein N